MRAGPAPAGIPRKTPRRVRGWAVCLRRRDLFPGLTRSGGGPIFRVLAVEGRICHDPAIRCLPLITYAGEQLPTIGSPTQRDIRASRSEGRLPGIQPGMADLAPKQDRWWWGRALGQRPDSREVADGRKSRLSLSQGAGGRVRYRGVRESGGAVRRLEVATGSASPSCGGRSSPYSSTGSLVRRRSTGHTWRPAISSCLRPDSSGLNDTW